MTQYPKLDAIHGKFGCSEDLVKQLVGLFKFFFDLLYFFLQVLEDWAETDWNISGYQVIDPDLFRNFRTQFLNATAVVSHYQLDRFYKIICRSFITHNDFYQILI